MTAILRAAAAALLLFVTTAAWAAPAPRLSDADRADIARIERYQRARDRAVLRAPEAVRARFADEWAGAVDRAVRTGVATLDAGGAVRIIK